MIDLVADPTPIAEPAQPFMLGDVTIFVTRPLSAAFLIAAAGMMLLIALPSLRAKREVALQE